MKFQKKLDELIYETEILSMMKIFEKSLKFLENEPDIYGVEDLKVRYE